MCQMKREGREGSDQMVCRGREVAEASVLRMTGSFAKMKNSGRPLRAHDGCPLGYC